MVLERIRIPGAVGTKQAVQVVRAQGYLESYARLHDAGKAIADTILASLVVDPYSDRDRLVDGMDIGTCLIRRRDGIYVVYQMHMTADYQGRTSKLIRILFCWKYEMSGDQENLIFPDWA